MSQDPNGLKEFWQENWLSLALTVAMIALGSAMFYLIATSDGTRMRVHIRR
jgi:hypothetical protein